jgi:hypothetical protein
MRCLIVDWITGNTRAQQEQQKGRESREYGTCTVINYYHQRRKTNLKKKYQGKRGTVHVPVLLSKKNEIDRRQRLLSASASTDTS